MDRKREISAHEDRERLARPAGTGCRKETVPGTRLEKERWLTRSQLRQAEALNRDYGKDILKGTNTCQGEAAWCASGK